MRRMHLLPYHRLGQDKYDGLNRPYLMGDVKPPTNEKMERLLKVAEEVSGCRVPDRWLKIKTQLDNLHEVENRENSENNHKKQQKQRLFKLTNVGLCGKIS